MFCRDLHLVKLKNLEHLDSFVQIENCWQIKTLVALSFDTSALNILLDHDKRKIIFHIPKTPEFQKTIHQNYKFTKAKLKIDVLCELSHFFQEDVEDHQTVKGQLNPGSLSSLSTAGNSIQRR